MRLLFFSLFLTSFLLNDLVIISPCWSFGGCRVGRLADQLVGKVEGLLKMGGTAATWLYLDRGF